VLPSRLLAIHSVEPSNVQLSRHRPILVVVGDVVRLRNSATRAAQRHGLLYRSATLTKIIKKNNRCGAQTGRHKRKKGKNYKRREGNAGIFVKM